MKRVVIAAGGTGGHFYPGLVLADTLRARGWEPLLLVRAGDPALAVLESKGIAAVEVDLKGLPRRPSLDLLRFPGKVVGAFVLVNRILRSFGPQAVVGMGGYLTFPALAAAAKRGIPRALHESNAVLGLANRMSLAFGAELFWGLPRQDGDGGTLTGTPIRPALWTALDAAAARRALGLDAAATVLVFGGSQGARALNRLVPAALAKAKTPQVLHLSGPKEAAEVEAAYKTAGLKATVLPYLEAMEQAYAAADVVICRSGASTLAELAAQRKRSVLIPFPHAAGNHQEINARVFERLGAAKVVLEQDIEASLEGQVRELLSGPEAAYPELGLPAPAKTAEALADAVERLT